MTSIETLPSVGTDERRDTVVATHRPCPVCSSSRSRQIRQLELVVPEDFSLQRSFSINTCSVCGTVFHDVKPEPDRDSYYESYTGAGKVDYRVTAEQSKLNELTFGFLQRMALTSPDISIADVGCSFGITLLSLQRNGFNNLYALDPDRAAIRYLTEQGIPGRAGSATDPIPELEGRFDLIMLRHVLEHLYSPQQAVENVSRWLKPGGFLYIELPDLSRFQETAPFPGFFFEYEHINHFSLYSLLNLMRGFRLVQFESTTDIYPCLRAVLQRSSSEIPLFFQTADEHAVEHSLSCANDTGRTVLENIARLGKREIALWGVSRYVYRLFSHTPLRDCNIRHLVDRDPKRQGEKLFGMTIQSPESLHGFSGTIVISGANSAENIKNSIRSMGLVNDVVCLLDVPPN